MAVTLDDGRPTEQFLYIDSGRIRVPTPVGYIIYRGEDDDILVVKSKIGKYTELLSKTRQYVRRYREMQRELKGGISENMVMWKELLEIGFEKKIFRQR